MPSTQNPRSFKMINHGFIEIRHDVVKTQYTNKKMNIKQEAISNFAIQAF